MNRSASEIIEPVEAQAQVAPLAYRRVLRNPNCVTSGGVLNPSFAIKRNWISRQEKHGEKMKTLIRASRNKTQKKEAPMRAKQKAKSLRPIRTTGPLRQIPHPILKIVWLFLLLPMIYARLMVGATLSD